MLCPAKHDKQGFGDADVEQGLGFGAIGNGISAILGASTKPLAFSKRLSIWSIVFAAFIDSDSDLQQHSFGLSLSETRLFETSLILSIEQLRSLVLSRASFNELSAAGYESWHSHARYLSSSASLSSASCKAVFFLSAQLEGALCFLWQWRLWWWRCFLQSGLLSDLHSGLHSGTVSSTSIMASSPMIFSLALASI